MSEESTQQEQLAVWCEEHSKLLGALMLSRGVKSFSIEVGKDGIIKYEVEPFKEGDSDNKRGWWWDLVCLALALTFTFVGCVSKLPPSVSPVLPKQEIETVFLWGDVNKPIVGYLDWLKKNDLVVLTNTVTTNQIWILK